MQKLPGICLKLFKKGILYLTPNRRKLNMWLVRYYSSLFYQLAAHIVKCLASRRTEHLENCSAHINIEKKVET